MEGRVFVRLMATTMVMAMMGQRGSAKLIKIGNSWQGWSPNSINFTQWASDQPFYVGVWIGFWYESKKHDYSVLEVNKTSYEDCIGKDFIKNVTGGAGRDVFNLTQAKTYYFISGGGYCWSGLKIAVPVRELPPAPAPAPATALRMVTSGSPSSDLAGDHAIRIVLSTLFCIMATIYLHVVIFIRW